LSVITLITDFGLKDGNVGVMKGVIWDIAPSVKVADISHKIQPQNILEASLILLRSAPYFPDGSIHVVVVDPGVGTARRQIAAKLGLHYFVGPDNGVVTMLLERVESHGMPVSFCHTNNSKYWLPDVSHVFHGRDIFAPVSAHIAAGINLEELGTTIENPIRIHYPRPMKSADGLRGEVIHIDNFGNISSNIHVEHIIELSKKENITICVSGVKVQGLVQTFGERALGELVALFGSTGNLIVSVVNGNAAERLGTKIGDTFEVVVE
jgi:S-adenosylmethionine hydrolase